MTLHPIQDLVGLKRHLYAALQLEHATIPPYLTALYSIRPGTNTEAAQIIRAVAVEEMLHLTLVGNVMNAIGDAPDLTRKGFVPSYPALLPDGEDDFHVDLRAFSPEAIETFLKIERPADVSEDGTIKTVARPRKHATLVAGHVHEDGDEHFHSIGEFYKAIEMGLRLMHAQMGDALFCGDPARQIGPEYYYSGGGGLIEVTDMETALAALDLIAEQGEGITGHVFDEDGEIAHYYRFQQLVKGRYYQEADTAGTPTGGPVEVDWSAAYPLKTNARRTDYESPPLRARIEGFDQDYARFLILLTEAFNGEPARFTDAVGEMFRIKESFGRIVRTPLDEQGHVHASPAFDIDAAMEAIR